LCADAYSADFTWRNGSDSSRAFVARLAVTLSAALRSRGVDAAEVLAAAGTGSRFRRLQRAIPAAPNGGHEESDMISELQIHVIARQMFEKHGFEAIAQAAQNAIACESKGESEEAREWRHLEDAMKMMRGPHQS